MRRTRILCFAISVRLMLIRIVSIVRSVIDVWRDSIIIVFGSIIALGGKTISFSFELSLFVLYS